MPSFCYKIKAILILYETFLRRMFQCSIIVNAEKIASKSWFKIPEPRLLNQQFFNLKISCLILNLNLF